MSHKISKFCFTNNCIRMKYTKRLYLVYYNYLKKNIIFLNDKLNYRNYFFLTLSI